MNVHVSLIAEGSSYDALKTLVNRWETEFPLAKVRGISCYGKWELTLDLPSQTQVVQPQLIDARSTVES